MLSLMFEISGLSTTLAHAVVVLTTAAVVICSPTGNAAARPSSSIVVGPESTSQVGRSVTVRPVVTTASAGAETNRTCIRNRMEREAERMRTLPVEVARARTKTAAREGRGMNSRTSERGHVRQDSLDAALPRGVPRRGHHEAFEWGESGKIKAQT